MKKAFPFVVAALLIASCGGSDSDKPDPAAVELAFREQFIARNEYYRGEEKSSELKEIAQDRSIPEMSDAVKNLLIQVEKIDHLTAERIAFLEALKKELFKDLGEDLGTAGADNSVLQRDYEAKEPLSPSLYALAKVKTTGTTDLISYDSGKGKEIVQSMQEFRKAITETIATYDSRSGEEHYAFKAPAINTYKDDNDLYRQIGKEILASNVAIDDQEAVKMIYIKLTRSEDIWKTLLSRDCSWVTAFHFLTQLQYEALEARADAISLIRSRVGGPEYGFDKIMVMTPGAEYAKGGSEIEFEVFVGAFDSYKQPVVGIGGGSAHIVEVREGKALISAYVPEGAGEIEIAGTITVVNKSGIPKTLPWRKKIVVGDK